MAGAVPVVGASVQLYAAGTAGNGSAPTALLSTPLTTNASGGFTVLANSYSCPAAGSVLLLVSSGGQVGTAAANSAIEWMAVPGVCSNVAANASFVLNELTTAAGVYAMRAFLAPGGNLGATATNSTGIALAAGTAANLVNVTTGKAPGAGFPATGTAPLAKLNSVANALHGCAASQGAASAACSGLFSATATATATPDNTLDALLSLADHPGKNVAAIYSLSQGGSAFTPGLTTAPADWTLPVIFGGGGMYSASATPNSSSSLPVSVALDAQGNVWVANEVGVASLFSNTGAPVFPAGITGYGLSNCAGGAVDASGNFWVTNEAESGSVTVLNASGPALSGDSQYTAISLDGPIAIAFDTNGDASIATFYGKNLTVLSGSGADLSGTNGYVSQYFDFMNAVAIDGNHNSWISNESDGNVVKVAPGGASSVAYTVGSGLAGLTVDAQNNVWSANFSDDAVGLISSAGQVLSSGGFTGGGLSRPVGIEADGNGTIWVANYRPTGNNSYPGLSELAGATASVPGTALSPAAGWAPDAGHLELQGLAIDAAGNVWVTSAGDGVLLEFVGLAAPVKTPLIGPVQAP